MYAYLCNQLTYNSQFLIEVKPWEFFISALWSLGMKAKFADRYVHNLYICLCVLCISLTYQLVIIV